MFCKNCGNTVSPNAKFCSVCGAVLSSESTTPQPPINDTPCPPPIILDDPIPPRPLHSPEPKSKKSKKLPIIIAVVSLTLVIAILAGVLAVAFTSNPLIKVFNAAKNTVFNSSEYQINFNYTEDDYFNNARISITLSDDINTSTLDFYNSYSGYYSNYTDNIMFKNGSFYADGEFEGYLSELLSEAEEDIIYYAPHSFNLDTEINNVINGKIDENALEEAVNNLVIPTIENILLKESDIMIDIPEYDDIFNTATDLLKDKEIRNSIQVKKIKSDIPGTTYEYSIALPQFARAITDYALSDEQYYEYFNILSDGSPYELAEEIIEEAEYAGSLSGTVTIKSDRIVGLTAYLFEYGASITLSVDSK